MKFRWEKEFKETEIGQIPREWEVRELKTLVIDIIKGKTPRKIYGKVPYLSAKYLRDEEEPEGYFDEKAGILVDQNDIIVLWDGSNAGEIFKGKEGLLASTMYKLIFKEGVEKKFIYIVLKSKENELKDAKSGTDDRHVDKDYFLTISIPYPPLPEQTRIATVLSYFDDLIENKKRQNEILEKTAMAIFKNWFIDFEPFKNIEFVDSEIGKIPKGWKVNFISKLIVFDPYEKLDKNVVYPYVEMKYVSTASMVCEFDHKHYTGSSSKFKFGDTLFARITPCLENGKTAFVWFLNNNEKGFGSTEFIVMRGRHEYMREFTYLFAKTDDFREFAINSMSGTSGRQRVDKEALEMYKFVIPPPSILQKFHSLVEPLFQKIINNQKQIMLLRKIRDTLLPLLVFGKLRVEEI